MPDRDKNSVMGRTQLLILGLIFTVQGGYLVITGKGVPRWMSALLMSGGVGILVSAARQAPD